MSVFGDVTAQTNGAPVTTPQDTQRPFGFGFGEVKTDAQSRQDQNLFFQCMTQNSSCSPSLAASQPQSKDTSYFTAAPESLNKELTSLFNPAASTEGLKKTEQPKVPETHPPRNGVISKQSSAFQGMGGSAGIKGTGGLTAASGSQNTSKKGTNNGTSVGGLIIQSGFKTTDSHQNIFLQASKEPANPFLAYTEKTPHTSFAGFSGAEPQALGPASDSKPNFFTMAEPPKGILSSHFPSLSPAASSSSSSSPAPASSQMSQCEGTVSKEEQDVSEIPSSTSGSPVFGNSGPSGMGEVPVSFDQSQSQKFTLEERGQTSKRDSESSSNSDLSDLSENEEGPEKSQIPGGPQPHAIDGALVQKSKISGAAKSRPRNKPFKCKSDHLKTPNFFESHTK